MNQTQTTPTASNISTIADNKNDAVNHTARKSLLHIGCGPKSMHDLQGFSPVQWQEIRFDIDPNVRPDVLGSMTDLQAIDNASVDAVYSSHNLEHVYAHEVATVLSEFRRVLKPSGFAIITCPDLQAVCNFVAKGQLYDPIWESRGQLLAPIDLIYGFRQAMAQGNLHMAHRTGFTLSALSQFISRAGFARVIGSRYEHKCNLWLAAFADNQSQISMLDVVGRHFPKP